MNDALADFSRLYIDSNVLIYFVEREDPIQRKVGDAIARAINRGRALVVSEIGVAECLYGAYKMQSSELEARYLEIFADIALFETVPVDGERLRAAARLGAQKGLKLVDAVHFLAAMETECDVFLTGDNRIRSSHGINVLALDTL